MTQIILIDQGVSDYRNLINSFPADSEVFFLDSDSNGLEQAAKVLEGYSNLSAVHVFSHGSPGTLQLGNSTITESNLDVYKSALTTIGNSLSEAGDILLYGCNVAEGDIGDSFIQKISAMTGADVAASTDLTGSTIQGGNWILEKTVGTAETNSFYFTDYVSTLATYYGDGMNPLPYFVAALVNINNLFWGEIGHSQILTYSFAISNTGSGEFFYDDNQKDTVRTALYRYSKVAGLQFVEIDDSADVDIRFFRDDPLTAIPFKGHEDQPGYTVPIPIADIHMNKNFDLTIGTYGYQALLHEIGHALALKHPFQEGPGIEPVLPFNEDNQKNTVMTYNNEPPSVENIGLFDIATVQYLYGVNQNARTGNDTYLLSDVRFIWDGAGIDTISASNLDVPVNIDLNPGSWIYSIEKQDSILAEGQAFIGFGTVIENVIGGSKNDNLMGNNFANILDGGDGQDQLYGGDGNDYIYGGDGEDVVYGGDGNDCIYGGEGQDVLYGGAGNDILDGGSGFEYGFDDFDTADYRDAWSGVTVDLNIIGPQNTIGDGIDTLIDIENFAGSEFDDTLTGDDNNNVLVGRAGNDSLFGNAGNDNMTGNHGNDNLNGGDGDDYLNGGEGDDIIDGGAGLDTAQYVYSSWSGVTVNLILSGIQNTVSAGMDILIGIENLSGGEYDDTLTGDSNNNVLDGYLGNDILDGLAGNDILIGNCGNDTYVFGRNYGQDLIENFGFTEDIDTILISGISPSNITLKRNGNDLVIGIKNLTDTITVKNHFTTDAIDRISFYNGTVWNADDLKSQMATYLTEGDDNYTGTEGDDKIDGLGGNDIIHGLAGNDEIFGGAGFDTLYGGDGNDTTYGNDGDDYLFGGAGRDMLFGDTGNDILDGGVDADKMVGGLGNDTYYVDNVRDIVTEDSDSGIDTVISSVTFTLGSNFEDLILTGTTAINGTGNAMTNEITGNSGDNKLDGESGADTMIGLKGNDIYIVDNEGDVIIEDLDSGIDTVSSSVTFTLGSNIENLILTGKTAINVTGNDLPNILTGNSNDNIIDGGGDADSMAGGRGNDIYYVDNVGDIVTETTSLKSEIDTVISTVSYTLGANLEDLILIGSSAINGSGNGLANYIKGNESANILNGGAGNDIIDGGFGNDTLLGETGNDTYLFKFGVDLISDSGGTDKLVFDSFTYDPSSIDIAIFKSGTDVLFDIGGGNQVMVAGQANMPNTVERFELPGGYYLTSADVNKVIQDMTSFADSNGIAMNSITDVTNSEGLMNIINLAWRNDGNIGINQYFTPY